MQRVVFALLVVPALVLAVRAVHPAHLAQHGGAVGRLESRSALLASVPRPDGACIGLLAGC
jgi:hypothetical protein